MGKKSKKKAAKALALQGKKHLRQPPGRIVKMGKKSKKKAAKALALQGSSTAGNAVGAGGTVSVGRKHARCVFCSGTVKTSEGKGHKCPGCSNICCYRCEKKQFCACPNGPLCVDQIRRCPNCFFGLSLLDEMGIDPKQIDSWAPADIMRTYAKKGGDLQRAIIPFPVCDDCDERNTMECFKCASSHRTRLRMCNTCKMSKCGACLEKSMAAMERSLLSAGKLTDGSKLAVSEFCAAAEEKLVQEVPNFMVMCSDCSEFSCVSCIEGNSLQRAIRAIVLQGLFYCDTCYYAKKPCTNPTCPNPIGIPTKRCGGCHISRYCSTECQAADYPEHEDK